MKLSELIAGATIASAYYDKPDGYHVGAGHDQVYLYATDRPMTSEDVQKMIDNGWIQEHYVDEDPDDPDDTGEFAAKHYNYEEPWTAYT